MTQHSSPSIVSRLCRGIAAIGLAAAVATAPGTVAPASAASVTRVFNGDESSVTFLYRGPVVAGDLGRLQDQTAKVPAGKRIVLLLESEGGSIDEGMAIGRYIHTAKVTTVAIQGPGCHSSCTFIFLAGRDLDTAAPLRILMKGARLGFHQGRISRLEGKNFSAEDVHAATQFGQNLAKSADAYFREIKADPEFLTMMLSAPSSSISVLNELDALRLGIYVMDPTTKRLVTPDQFR